MEHLIPLRKTAVALFVSIYAGSAFAYTEAGQLGNIKSWESAEYQKDWGLTSMNASTAYAMGFTGKGVNIGVMDSGVLLSHPEFQDGRIHVVKTTGTYDKDGMRYPDAAYGNGPINKNAPVKDGKRNFDKTDNGNFKKGKTFDIDGAWHKFTNDAHGTHVGGTMAASRDGSEMHGVAFESNLYSANTGGNDNMTYGPNQDYQFFLKGYTALADAGAKVINNSWGSNRRVNSSFNGALGYKAKYEWRDVPEYGVEYYDVAKAPDPINDPSAHIYLKDLTEAKKAYYQFVTGSEKNFVDAAYEVAKNKQVIQVFTAGNRSMMAESFTRAMLPYFRPDAEKYWVNVTGQAGGEGYPNDSSRDVYDNKAASDIQEFNLAGHSKWWTIAAPAENIYSAYVELQNDQTYGQAMYRSAGGTSMAAPHVSGALGVIFSRYPYMTTDQARDVMLTTARQTTMRKGIEGQKLERWESELGVPSKVWGWGILDLGKAMFGPGQFLGEFNVSLNQDDVWSNDISDKAIKARKVEDEQEAKEWAARKPILQAAMQDRAGATAEEKAEYQVGLDRETARNQRVAQGYEGTLVKNGTGTLTLTGTNTFTGTVTVNEGQLSALNQSLASSKEVVVNQGGALEMLPKAAVTKPGKNGFVTDTITSLPQTVTATIHQGGKYLLNDGVNNVSIVFDNGALLSSLSKTLTDNYAFFSKTTEANTFEKQAMAETARNDNEAALLSAIENSSRSAIYQGLILSNQANAYDQLNRLSYDSDLAAQQHNLVNNFMLRQQLAQPAGVKAKLNQSTQLWTSGTYHHLSTDGLSTRSYNQLLGVDTAVTDNANLGVFFGATKNTHKNDRTSKDRALHLGVYGDYALTENLNVKGGLIHSWGKEEKRLAVANQHKTHSKTADVFAELAYNAVQSEHFALEPYAGVSYLHIKTDGFTEGEIRVKENKRNLLVTSMGLRPSIPFSLGGVSLSLQGDVAYHRFHHDRAPQATMVVNDNAEAVLYGKKLTHLVTTGVALEANITPALSVKVGYQGAYNRDTQSNGVNAQLRYAF
ncbi:S8 family peptidase [Aggregatibacter kilianii]|uniref:S8 family peptidase n=1 Tax=Aggregatibacter kilianii TaxID=2025884 RepID=UPI000D652AEA|nr:S8 family serine peptidase [Aggregatibacter kilianii]